MTLKNQFPGKMRNRAWLAWFCIAIITTVIYSQTVGYGILYNYDDDAYFNDHTINELTSGHALGYFKTYYLGMYQPIPVLSFAVVMKIFPGSVEAQRVLNILLHLLNTFLVLLLINRITGKKSIGFLVALLFAIHPMHVESVSWLSARGNLVYSLFYLAALALYASWRKEKKYLQLASFLLMFIFSLFSKVTAATFPFLVLALDLLWAKTSVKKALALFIPLLLVSLIFIVAGVKASGSFGHITELSMEYTISDRIMLILNALWIYLSKAFVPLDQSVIYLYPWKTESGMPGTYYLFGLVALVLLVAATWAGWKKRNEAHWAIFLVGIMFFLISIGIVLPLKWSRTILLAERYTYVPYIGLFLAVLSIVSHIYDQQGKWIRRGLIVLTGAVVLVYGFRSFERNKVWKSPITLFSDVIMHGRSAAEISMGYYNRGNERLRLGDLGNSLYDYSGAIRLHPRFEEAYYNRGLVHIRMGNYQDAISDLTHVIGLNEGNPSAYLNRGIANRSSGNFKSALDDLNRSIQLDPNPLAFFNRGSLHYFNLGDSVQACSDWQKSYALGYLPALEVFRKFCH